MSMVEEGKAHCVCGNHDEKLLKYLKGKRVSMSFGIDVTVEQLKKYTKEEHLKFRDFIQGLRSHYVLDDGKLVVAHAGIREIYHGRASGRVRNLCLYGETTGETDENGHIIRINWAKDYKGKATVVYGHVAVAEAEWLNNTIDIDTGCVFGNKLTALRYPEMEIVQVPAKKDYAQSGKVLGSLLDDARGHEEDLDGMLALEDVMGTRSITTKLMGSIRIREESSIAALESMSRFSIDPRWLIYLPPTMSPTETSEKDEYLEYPNEAFDYYLNRDIKKVICEEKHMGSRALLIVCRDEAAVKRRFGMSNAGIGTIYTRTGRAFFEDKKTKQALLIRLREALDKVRFWHRFDTDWVLLDAELLPWSAKAQKLLETQYAAVGRSAQMAFDALMPLVEQGEERGLNFDIIKNKIQSQQEQAAGFTEAYRAYCWSVEKLEDYKIAPFHILATEGKTYTNMDHRWHMETLKGICQQDEDILYITNYKIIDVTNEAEREEAIQWWLKRTAEGEEGMVIKPLEWIHQYRNRLVQPAIKCRGREYLRLIYGPEYTTPVHLERLKKRGLGRKRALAKKEFSLGIEALERFVANKPFRRVHECVFAVLALESEEVDPRL